MKKIRIVLVIMISILTSQIVYANTLEEKLQEVGISIENTNRIINHIKKLEITDKQIEIIVSNIRGLKNLYEENSITSLLTQNKSVIYSMVNEILEEVDLNLEINKENIIPKIKLLDYSGEEVIDMNVTEAMDIALNFDENKVTDLVKEMMVMPEVIETNDIQVTKDDAQILSTYNEKSNEDQILNKEQVYDTKLADTEYHNDDINIQGMVCSVSIVIVSIFALNKITTRN